jgi:hypothetical protein
MAEQAPERDPSTDNVLKFQPARRLTPAETDRIKALIQCHPGYSFPGGPRVPMPAGVDRGVSDMADAFAYGLCAVAPDPDADFRAGFTAGVAAERKLQAARDASEAGWVDPTPHGKTGLGVLIAIGLLVAVIIGLHVIDGFAG